MRNGSCRCPGRGWDDEPRVDGSTAVGRLRREGSPLRRRTAFGVGVTFLLLRILIASGAIVRPWAVWW
jgi:hypothetical protein